MPTIDRALYAFAATMMLLAVVGHTLFNAPHAVKSNNPAPVEQHQPTYTPFEGTLIV